MVGIKQSRALIGSVSVHAKNSNLDSLQRNTSKGYKAILHKN